MQIRLQSSVVRADSIKEAKAMANNISRANRIKRSPGDAFVQVLLYVFVALFAIATVIPFLYVLAGSFEIGRAHV